MEMPYRCLLHSRKQWTRPIWRPWQVVWFCSFYQTFPSSLPNYLDGSALLCQYNCCRKMNWGSAYPVTADLSNVSDEGDWLPVTGSSIWWSSVPMGRGSAKDISEGFTSMDSDKGLFWLWMDSCSLKELSSAVESGEVSGPVETNKETNQKKMFKSSCRDSVNSLSSDCQSQQLVCHRLPGQMGYWCFHVLQSQASCKYSVTTGNHCCCCL